MSQLPHCPPAGLAREFAAWCARAEDDAARTAALRDRIRARRVRHVATTLCRHERDWRLSPADAGDPAEVSPFAMRRELFLEQAAWRLLRLAPPDAAAIAAPAGVESRLAEAMRGLKYFPVLFISAPHVEAEVTGTFPGIPTPLLSATTVLDRHLRLDEFPALHVPEIVAVMNPLVYDEAFEQQLDACLTQRLPRVVGISNMSEGHHFAMRIAHRVKAHLPGALVILGGAHEDGTNPEVYRNAAERARTGGRPGRGVPDADRDRYALDEPQLQRMEPLQTLALDSDRAAVDFVAAGDCPYLVMTLMTVIAEHLHESADGIKRRILDRPERFRTQEGSGYLFFCHPDTGRMTHVTLSGRPLDRNTLPFIDLSRLTQENRFPVFQHKKTAQVMACVGCKYRCAFCFESADQVLYEVPKLQPRDPENVIKEIDLRKELGYEAVFFDDSTFTQNAAATARLLALMIERAQGDQPYVEWGCQTTINDVNPRLLQDMHAAGCSYVYFGLETAHPDADRVQKAGRLRIVTGEESWADRFRRVAGWCNDAGIRVGTSLQFGPRDAPEQRARTLDLVAELCRAGFIARQSVALNVNTPYPGTDQWLDLMKEPERPLPDYRDRLRRHPGFETAHQFSALPSATADELYAQAIEKLGDAIVGGDTDIAMRVCS